MPGFDAVADALCLLRIHSLPKALALLRTLPQEIGSRGPRAIFARAPARILLFGERAAIHEAQLAHLFNHRILLLLQLLDVSVHGGVLLMMYNLLYTIPPRFQA